MARDKVKTNANRKKAKGETVAIYKESQIKREK